MKRVVANVLDTRGSFPKPLSSLTIYGVAMGCVEMGTKLNKSRIDNRLMVPTKLTRSRVVVSDSTVAVGGSRNRAGWSSLIPFPSPPSLHTLVQTVPSAAEWCMSQIRGKPCPVNYPGNQFITIRK